MKKILLIFSMVVASAAGFGQAIEYYYDLNFEDTFEIKRVRIDTLSYPNNRWQIGTPHKTHFTSAFSLPRAIVTDTLNPYPVNDTSVFTITHVAGDGYKYNHTVTLWGKYYVNSDSLTDYGTIEFSPDNGNSWIDLIKDSVLLGDQIWWIQKPVLTGNSNGWSTFYMNISNFQSIFDIPYGDTVLYRFTFISDSIQTNKDGLMFDNFYFEDYVEGIEEIQNDNLISIYPNPANERLTVKINQPSSSQSVQLLNCQGQIIYEDNQFSDDCIDLKQLTNGFYVLRYSDEKAFSIKKFTVHH